MFTLIFVTGKPYTHLYFLAIHHWSLQLLIIVIIMRLPNNYNFPIFFPKFFEGTLSITDPCSLNIAGDASPAALTHMPWTLN
jgi:hypothetical protein